MVIESQSIMIEGSDYDEEEGGVQITAGDSTQGEEEREKGIATQNQLRLWDALLEVRIRMHKMMSETNKLPQLDVMDALINSEEGEEAQLPSTMKKTSDAVQEFLDSLLELQELMIKSNSETNAGVNKTKKKNKKEEGADGDENEDEENMDDDNEEIPSDDETLFGIKGVANGEGKDDEEEEEEEGLEEKSSDSSPPPKKKKRKLLDQYETDIVQQFQNFSVYRNNTIQKWNEKTQLSYGKFRGGGGGGKNSSSSAPQIPVLKQISHILSDKPRLIKRTQTKRTAYPIIGKTNNNEEDEATTTGAASTSAQDEEIFDDDDFYHQLLRELIDRKTSNIKDPVELSRQWLELQKMRTKLKRKVDTDASKGRKIRYDVHPKLVNFMAPQDKSTMSDGAVKELMNSLFGKLSTNNE